ncbi:MAG TPA: SDR family oxidoreductase [Acidimicrobiales bacterium]|nr:polyketide synthase [Actinomycetota bacterium]MDP6061589.1 SDR family oxidoreductase [Acidimicrobiales bacterium]MDP7208566.1 SDR family oxidoreductase [Acidimicrobiales bacterium]HJL88958.1 SDR family oxidoreductase [Acidimicrobiales bacterium]HJO99947.1 SDR family oxidoreductase [Acidimicrobiales bacterium]
MGEFDGRVAIVTGSTSGIGEATAQALVATGAKVVVNSSSSVDAGKALAGELGAAVHYHRADVSNEDECTGLIDATLEVFGRLDILVNNAGYTQVIPHHDLNAVTEEVFRRIIDVNVFGTWYLSRAAVPALKASGDGNIINITSIAGLIAGGSCIPYAVSKAGLNHLTRLMANVLGPEVRVNAVAPGLVETPWTETWDALHSAVSDRAPLGRSGTSEDCAEAVLGILRAGYQTGDVVVVDGGLTLGGIG